MNPANIISKSWALICALFIMIAAIAEAPNKENYYEPVSEQHFALTDALVRAQAMTDDGVSYIYSSNFFLIRTELDTKTIIAANYAAIPMELLTLGCSHIGGISYANGKIYAPIEDSKTFQHLYIGVYDSKTLELLNYYPLPLEYQENGAPWCVADPDNGVLYTARRDRLECINVFDLKTLEFIKTIPIDYPVHKAQGGDMYKGILYLSMSRDEQAVYAINPETGHVQKAFARNLPGDAEGEGMTILKTDDGALFHVLDISTIGIVAHQKNYDFNPDTLVWDEGT